MPRIGVQKTFFEHGHVEYQIDGDDERNRMQVKFSPQVKVVILGEVNRSNIIKFQFKVNFKDLYSKLRVCTHK